MLWALHEGVASVLPVLVVFQLRIVLTVVANSHLSRGVFGSWTYKTSPVWFASLVIYGAVLVKGAVRVICCVGRVVIVQLLVVEVGVVGLAVWVLILFVIEEPHEGSILKYGWANIVSTISVLLRGIVVFPSGSQLVCFIPLFGRAVCLRELISFELS